MKNKQIDKAKPDNVVMPAGCDRKPVFQEGKLYLSKVLETHPIFFVTCAIVVLVIIAIVVWVGMRHLQSYLRMNGISTFSMDDGLANWFSCFIGYTGAVATVVLGILTVRLTIKQNQSSDFAAINELRLSDFWFCDLWQHYIPNEFEGDQGRRFVLEFRIQGLKSYYRISSIDLSWRRAEEGRLQYFDLENQIVYHQSTDGTTVTAYFDDFPDCVPIDSMNYFLHLGLYEPKMMPLAEKRRWLKIHMNLNYADNSMESDVCCHYLLQYDEAKGHSARPKPIDHHVTITSFPKSHSWVKKQKINQERT